MLLTILVVYVIVGAILLAIGTGIGFFLHWLIPAVDLGIGILIGVLTTGFTVQILGKTLSLPLDDTDDVPLDEPVELSRRVTYLIDPEPPPRRRRRKQTKADST